MTATPSRTKRRPEIEGLRTVAALLVAVYHIWVGRVSGGVDVFFVVTGFFITLTLLKHVDGGRIRPVAYFSRLFRRLMPGAAVVLIAVGALTVWFAPVTLWRRNFEEIVASSLSVENLYLAFNAIDYLNAEDPATPAQHFWAMSIQAQFYVFWLLLACLALVIVRMWAVRPKRAMMALIGVVFVVSLGLSIWQTHTMQPFAYFVPWTRMWEFSIGGALALLGARIHLRGAWAGAVSWLALLVLVSTGALLPVDRAFPGIIAAVPALAAAGILLSTREDERWWAGTRVLSWRPFVWLGSIAFGIYLWHWPLLMLHRYVFGLESRPGLLAGLAIIVVSVALAYATKMLFEAPVSKSWEMGRAGRSAVSVALIAAWTAAVGIPVGAWAVDQRQPPAEAVTAEPTAAPAECQGAGALASDFEACREALETMPLQPPRADVRDDIHGAFRCYTAADASAIRDCAAEGAADGLRIAIIGNSHAAMMSPAFVEAADERGWSVLPIVANGCVWLLHEDDEPGCGQRIQQQESLLLDDPFDAVIALGSAMDRTDAYPSSVLERRVEQLLDAGSAVLVMEDNPRLTAELAACAQEVSGVALQAGACDIDERDGYDYYDGYWEVGAEIEGVITVPTRDLYCVDGICPIVIGNVIVYRDRHHLTMTYVEEIFPEILERIDARTDALITT